MEVCMTNLNSHLNFRMSSHDKKLIEVAATLNGMKPQTYARQKILEAAEKDIIEKEHLNSIVMSNQDWECFMDVMKAPVIINKNLKNAVKKFKQLYEK